MWRQALLALWISAATAAHAECVADVDRSGSTDIADAVLTVNEAVAGCDTFRCPYDFTDDSVTVPVPCIWVGTVNDTCTQVFRATIVSNGSRLIATLSGIQSLVLGAVVDGDSAARIEVASAFHFEFSTPAAGFVSTDAEGRLTIEPDALPDTIDGCAIERFVGTYAPGTWLADRQAAMALVELATHR